MTPFITIKSDTLTPRLTQFNGNLQKLQKFFEAMGARLVKILRDHFKARQGEGNKRGWPSRGFWFGTDGVAQHTNLLSADQTGATVIVDDLRFAHKVHGGRITAKRGKMLALPLNAEAYAGGDKGRIPDVFPDLKLIVTAKGGWLVRSLYERKAKSSGKWMNVKTVAKSPTTAREKFQFMFRLTPSVVQPADPRALPSDAEILQQLRPAAENWMSRR